MNRWSRALTAAAIYVFANHVFVETSGFTEQELIGSPHNLVRHPHMPEQAFANLWATIKARRPWDGLVKNRAKSGDFYWVRANVTPVVESGEVAGYISIRSKPTRAQIETAVSGHIPPSATAPRRVWHLPTASWCGAGRLPGWPAGRIRWSGGCWR